MYKKIFGFVFALFLVLGLNVSNASASYTASWGGIERTVIANNCLYTGFSTFCSPLYAYPEGNGTFFWNIADEPASYPYTFTNGGMQGVVISNWTSNTPPPTPSSNAGIFFPKDEITGVTTATDLTASVGSATGATVSSLTPIVAIVGGIILAFIGINWVVGTIYGTDERKKKNKKV
jgi:hypothetical protein